MDKRRFSVLRGVLLVIALVVSSLGFADAQTFAMAQAAPVQTFQNVATGRCLDSNGAGNVYTHGCNGGAFQKWNVSRPRSSVVVLSDLATGLCLDSNGAGNVYTHGCNGGAFQEWLVLRPSSGTITFKNVATGRCPDSDGAGNVCTHGCNGGAFQRWR